MNQNLETLITSNFLCPWCKVQMEQVTDEDNRMCRDCPLFFYNSGNYHNTICSFINNYYVYFDFNNNCLSIRANTSSLIINIDSLPPFPSSKDLMAQKLKLYLVFQ